MRLPRWRLKKDDRVKRSILFEDKKDHGVCFYRPGERGSSAAIHRGERRVTDQ